MSKVAKLVFVLLVILLIASGVFGLSLLQQKTTIEQSKVKLEGEVKSYKEKEKKFVDDNKKLQEQLREAQGNEQKIQEQFSDLSGRVNSLIAERDDWKGKVDDLKRERNQLLAKLQEKPGPSPAAPAGIAPSEIASQPQFSQPMELPNAALPAGQEKYWASVLKEKAGLEIKIKGLQGQLNSGVMELAELKKINSDLALELDQLRADRSDIDRRIKYSEELANTLSVELTREKNDKRLIGESSNNLREDNAALRGQVKGLTTEKLALEKNIAKLTTEKESIDKKLTSTENMLQERANEVMDIQKSIDHKIKSATDNSAPSASLKSAAVPPSSSMTTDSASVTPGALATPGSSPTMTPSSRTMKEIELPPIIVSVNLTAENKPKPKLEEKVSLKSGSDKLTEGLKGRVLSVNKANNFVVVDLGEDSGIHVGDSLDVYHGEEKVSTLEVIQVRKAISAADIKQKGAIDIGDVVVR